jgi:excisionase family DNA binding protein
VLPTYLTPAELSDLLRIPSRTLEDWRLRGRGPKFARLGRGVRYDLDDVIAWAEHQKVER